MDHSRMSTEEISILSLTSRSLRMGLAGIEDRAERKKIVLDHIVKNINRMNIDTISNLLKHLYKNQSAILPVLQRLTQECAAVEILQIAEEESRRIAPR